MAYTLSLDSAVVKGLTKFAIGGFALCTLLALDEQNALPNDTYGKGLKYFAWTVAALEAAGGLSKIFGGDRA